MKYLIGFFFLLALASCARVPQQSVELSATVGRDIVQAHAAHKTTAELLFSRMKEDINQFVDEVYAPYQIQMLLEADMQDFNNQSTESLFYSLHAATEEGNAAKQKEVMDRMEFFVRFIREDVESYRKALLAPVLQQEQEVLTAIDRSYNQIIYANSIVTGHLASVRKVHDAHEEILNEIGLEGLREQATVNLAAASARLSEVLDKTRKADLDKIEEQLRELRAKMGEVFNN